MRRDGCTTRHTRRPPGRWGLTLIELLVVMTILTLLVTAAIPVLSPSSNERRLREASRGVNTFFGGAQARAIATGRPFGVMLKKLSQDTGDPDDNAVCLEMFYVEQPKPYAGFLESSRVMVTKPNPALERYVFRFVARNAQANGDATMPAGWARDLVPPRLFRKGDRIEVGGAQFLLVDGLKLNDTTGYFEPAPNDVVFMIATPVGGDSVGLTSVYDNQGDLLTEPQPPGQQTTETPGPYWSAPMAYKIHRQPVLTSAPPYQLPEGTAIDLRASGTPTSVFHRAEPSLSYDQITSNKTAVTIMFAPDGSVSSLAANLGQPADDGQDSSDDNSLDTDDIINPQPVTSSIFLLVGKRENIPSPLPPDALFAGFNGTESELQEAKAEINWLDGENRWVAISGATGVVTTSPVSFVNPVQVANQNTNLTFPEVRDREIALSRELAVQKTQEGGR